MGMSHGIDHYEILGLTGPISTKEANYENLLKRAYHDALLRHHPDKSAVDAKSAPSIDTIKLAFSVLSDPAAKAKHDQELVLRRKSLSNADATFLTGEELFDLDDMTYEPEQNQWYRSCRCGEEKGFVVTEEMLETAESKSLREVLISCIGCSLWRRVAFDVADDSQDPSLGRGS